MVLVVVVEVAVAVAVIPLIKDMASKRLLDIERVEGRRRWWWCRYSR